MQKVNKFFAEHSLAVGLAVLVGAISVAPQLYFAVFSRASNGVHMYGTDAEEHYIARVQEVLDGNWSLSNVFLPDKTGPYVSPAGGEIMAAFFSKIFFIDAAGVNLLLKFILPSVLFLIIYFFLLLLFSSEAAALVAATAVLLGNNLISGPAGFWGLLHFFSNEHNFLVYARPINPIIGSIFLFGSLYLLAKAEIADDSSKKRLLILFGLVSGLSIYVYIYVWSFLFVFFGLYILYTLYGRDLEGALWSFGALAANLAVSALFWINFIQLRSNQFYDATAARLGLIGGSDPIFSWWLFLLLFVLLFFWPKGYNAAKQTLLLSVFALWIVIDQQIFTGIALQVGHYHWYIVRPLAAIVFSFLFVYAAGRVFKRVRWSRIAIGCAIIVLFYNAALVQFSSYRFWRETAVEDQKYSVAMRYLESHYLSAQTVWADRRMSELLPIYTKHDAPNNGYAEFYLNSEEYFLNRLFLEYRMRGLDPDQARSAMFDERRDVSKRVFGLYFRELYGSYEEISDIVLAGLADKYRSFYDLPFEDALRYFGIDILVVNADQDRILQKNGHNSTLQKVKDLEGGSVVYQVVPAI